MIERDLIIVGDEAYPSPKNGKTSRPAARSCARTGAPTTNATATSAAPTTTNGERPSGSTGASTCGPTFGRTAAAWWGSLHDGGCTGPTKATGCRCSKIKCRYDKP